MDEAERMPFDMTDSECDPDFEGIQSRLYQILVKTTQREAKASCKDMKQDGFAAWNRIVAHYDPRRGMDACMLNQKIMYPVPVKSVQEARVALPQWSS